MILKEYIKRRKPFGRGIQHAGCNFAFKSIPTWVECTSSVTYSNNGIVVSGTTPKIKTSGVVINDMDLISVRYENLNLTNDNCSCSIVFENEDSTIKFGLFSVPNENRTYFKIISGGAELMSKIVGEYNNVKYWYLAYGKNANANYSFASYPRNIEISYSPTYDLFVVEDEGFDVFQTTGIKALINLNGNWSATIQSNYNIKTSNVVFELQQSVV